MKTSLPILLLSLTLLSPPAPGAEEMTKERLQKLTKMYQEARLFQIQKEYAKAVAALQEIIKELPAPKEGPFDKNLAVLHYNLSGNHAMLGQKKEALQALAKAVEHGYWDHQVLLRDDALKALREEKEFQATVSKARGAILEVAFGLKDVLGRQIQKKDYEGKVVVLDIWGTWCPPCKLEIPHFIQLQEKFRKDGFAVLGLNWERGPPNEIIRKRVEDFAKQEKINYQLALAPPQMLFNVLPTVGSFPTTFYIDREGHVVDRVTGMEGYAEIEARVLRLLKEKQPELPKAKPVEPPAEKP